MSVNWSLLVDLGWPIVLLVVGATINHVLERRERLIAHLGHISAFKLDIKQPNGMPTWVYTHSLVVRNNGRRAAENIRLGHNYLPNVTINPDIEYEIVDLPSGGREIRVPKLVPKKEITVSYLYFPPTTWNQINTHLESDNGPIKVVNVLLQVQPPKWILWILWFLIIVGLIGTVYVVTEIILRVAT